jgi:hypothetical protein
VSRYIQPGQPQQPSPPAQANSYIQPGTPPQAMPSPPQSRHRDDAAAFIVSANLERRNLTKGQQAMALAMIYPKPEQGKRRDPELRKKLGLLGRTERAGGERLRQARTILHHSRALAEAVMANRTSFDEALKTVEEERRAGQSIDQKLAELRAEEARDEAVERAHGGEHISKADAEALIAEALRAERAKFEAIVADLQAASARDPPDIPTIVEQL